MLGPAGSRPRLSKPGRALGLNSSSQPKTGLASCSPSLLLEVKEEVLRVRGVQGDWETGGGAHCGGGWRHETQQNFTQGDPCLPHGKPCPQGVSDISSHSACLLGGGGGWHGKATELVLPYLGWEELPLGLVSRWNHSPLHSCPSILSPLPCWPQEPGTRSGGPGGRRGGEPTPGQRGAAGSTGHHAGHQPLPSAHPGQGCRGEVSRPPSLILGMSKQIQAQGIANARK